MSFNYAPWPSPANVFMGWSTRESGFSGGAFAHNNVARHVAGDVNVDLNRALLRNRLKGQPDIRWLNQTHSTNVTLAETANRIDALDGAYTRQVQTACCVMTADCLPVFFWSRCGGHVAVAHAGWRGLANGVLANTLAAFTQSEVVCGIGPAISQAHFEVGDDVRDVFAGWPEADANFLPGNQPGKYWCNLAGLASAQLKALGVRQVYLSGICTYANADKFYSFRRDGLTGRMANLIWRVSR